MDAGRGAERGTSGSEQRTPEEIGVMAAWRFNRTRAKRVRGVFALIVLAGLGAGPAQARDVDLKGAVILVAAQPQFPTEPAAARMLQEEVQRRAGLKWDITAERPGRKPVIVLAGATESELAGLDIPRRSDGDLPEFRPEGYRICVRRGGDGEPVIWVIGADARGVLFGVGRLIRLLDCGAGRVSLDGATEVSSAPA
jgi:hypothetical protein